MTDSRELTQEQGEELLEVARETLEASFGRGIEVSRDDPWMHEPGACFVTLLVGGELRGCVGSLWPRRPLIEDVRNNTLAAAFRDGRFRPLTAGELTSARLELSVLGPMEPVRVESEEELAVRLRPHVDGLVLRHDTRCATYLPQVWQSLPEARSFIRQLKVKAGLAADFWSPELQIWSYRCRKWREAPSC